MRTVLSCLVMAALVVLAQTQSAAGVSEEYFIDTYQSIRAYHTSIGNLITLRPADNTLRIFAFKAIEQDYGTFKTLEAPAGFEGMKGNILRAMEFRMASLQLFLQGKKGAQQYWIKGDAEIEAVEAFLASRRAEKAEPPPLDANFKPKEVPLTVEQYADRYFLIRMVNKGLGVRTLLKAQNEATVNHARSLIQIQSGILKETQYPAEMKELHSKVLAALHLTEQWFDSVKAKKLAEASALQKQVEGLYAEIDKQLMEKFKITIPKAVVQ